MILLTVLFIILAVYFARKGDDRDTSLGKAIFISAGITIGLSIIVFALMRPFVRTEKVINKKVVLLDNPGSEYYMIYSDGDTAKDDSKFRDLDDIFLDEKSDSSYHKNHCINYSDKIPGWLTFILFTFSDATRIKEDVYLCPEDWKRYIEARKANN